jgi:hypothetical protein
MVQFNVGMVMVGVGILHEALTPMLPNVAKPTWTMLEAGWINFHNITPSHEALFFHAMGLQMVALGLMMHYYIADSGYTRPLPLPVGVLLLLGGLALGLATRIGLSGYLLVSFVGAFIVYTHVRGRKVKSG